MAKPIIGISIGDINSISSEILLKTLDDNRVLDICTPIIFGSNKVLNFYKKSMPDVKIIFNNITSCKDINSKLVNIFTCWEEEIAITPGVENEIGGKYAIRSLQVATQCLKDGEIHGLVTMPISKNNTQLPDFKHTGHTPFLKSTFNAKDVLMLLCTETLKVALLTEHVAISEISKLVTKENIVSKINILSTSLLKDFGIVRPKIAVLALNPHAGDKGLIGKEEKEIISPAIQELNDKGNYVFGPYAADAFFARQMDSKFDAVLAMYHDQGLIPFKSFDKEQGVNFTAGLPVVRTSPDHGTAFDIAGKNIASNASFLQALYTCIDIINQRSEYAINAANPIKRNNPNTMFKKNKESVSN